MHRSAIITFTCVLHRLVKERNMYILEAEEQEAKVEQMQTDGKDEYLIKKQVLSADRF